MGVIFRQVSRLSPLRSAAVFSRFQLFSEHFWPYIAEETVAAAADIVLWLQAAIAHFYPESTYARALDVDVRERAARRVLLPPTRAASAICPYCGAHNASEMFDELLAFVCRRCGAGVKVEPPKVQ